MTQAQHPKSNTNDYLQVLKEKYNNSAGNSNYQQARSSRIDHKLQKLALQTSKKHDDRPYVSPIRIKHQVDKQREDKKMLTQQRPKLNMKENENVGQMQQTQRIREKIERMNIQGSAGRDYLKKQPLSHTKNEQANKRTNYFSTKMSQLHKMQEQRAKSIKIEKQKDQKTIDKINHILQNIRAVFNKKLLPT